MNNGKATIKRATAGVGTPLKKDTFSVIRLNLANRKAAPNGIKKPMGIGNHGFYEHVTYANENPTSKSPYYGFILDDKGMWVDSHFFGVDGPILHLDEIDPNLLHFWLLSFERHAMVTHLTFPI